MKKYLAGLFTGLLAVSLLTTALAISGRMTIEVDPINVQVNGEVFQPTDVTGAEVPVFAYNGTTYAPLRALAEAYGLEVGYDAVANMATVNDPDAQQPATPDTTANAPDYSDWSEEDEAAYQEFKAMWEVEYAEPRPQTGNEAVVTLHCKGREDVAKTFLHKHTAEFIEQCCHKLDTELYTQYGDTAILYRVTLDNGNWGWRDDWRENKWNGGYRDAIS